VSIGFASLDKINVDVDEALIPWREMSEGAYFKVLLVHEINNTVAFRFKMDAGAPDFQPHRHICRAMTYTLHGEHGYRGSDTVTKAGTFLYEASGSFHQACTYGGHESIGLFESDTPVLLELHEADDPESPVTGQLTVPDLLAYAHPLTHVVHHDGTVSGESPKFHFG
jgi:hypothetical protein